MPQIFVKSHKCDMTDCTEGLEQSLIWCVGKTMGHPTVPILRLQVSELGAVYQTITNISITSAHYLEVTCADDFTKLQHGPKNSKEIAKLENTQ